MKKTWLIVRHEFRQTVGRKGYVILTLAFPVIGLLAIGALQYFANAAPPPPPQQKTVVGYVDLAGGFGGQSDQPRIELVPYPGEIQAKQALLNGDVSEYFVIPADYLSTGQVTLYNLERQLETSGDVSLAIRNFLINNLLDGSVQPEVIQRVESPLSLSSVTLSDTGEVAPTQGGFGAFILPYIFSILLVMSIFFSAGYLLQGLGEEKENRVMEILLSSVSPRELLTGKVLALGASGLLQVAVWLFSAFFLVRLAASSFGTSFTIELPVGFVVLGIIYFILGYLVYAILLATIGAVSPTAREGQQLSAIFTLAGVSPLWISFYIIQNPQSPITIALTIFPLTAPVTVMARYGLAEIPAWELAVSIAVLALSSVGLLLFSARVFRTFLLMYGKRPGLREIIRASR